MPVGRGTQDNHQQGGENAGQDGDQAIGHGQGSDGASPAGKRERARSLSQGRLRERLPLIARAYQPGERLARKIGKALDWI